MRMTSVVPRLATSPAPDLPGQPRPEPDRRADDELLHPHHCLEEVAHGPAVPEHTGSGLDDAQSQHHGRPEDQVGPASPRDRIDRLSERGGDHSLGSHPDGAEERPADDGSTLPARDPKKEPEGRAKIRVPRIGKRNLRKHGGGQV